MTVHDPRVETSPGAMHWACSDKFRQWGEEIIWKREVLLLGNMIQRYYLLSRNSCHCSQHVSSLSPIHSSCSRHSTQYRGMRRVSPLKTSDHSPRNHRRQCIIQGRRQETSHIERVTVRTRSVWTLIQTSVHTTYASSSRRRRAKPRMSSGIDDKHD